MEKASEQGISMINQNDTHLVQRNRNSDSSDEDGCDSEEEIIVLEAVSSIIKRSLKRKRRPSNIHKQKRTKIVRDRRQGRQVVDKDVLSAKNRYNVTSLVQIMQDFDENQKGYLREIDFGAILDLTSGTVPWSFVQWLADHVDIKKEGFAFQQKFIPISPESFGHVLGVPAIGIPVPQESKFTTAEFLQLFGLSEMPPIKFFRDKIKKGQDKVEFIRCFMIVALSSFYCPTSSTKPSTAYLAALMDVKNIKTYNWAKYFQEWNLWYIKKYQKSSSTLAVCNFYIAVRYLDFLDFGSVQIQISLPRISVWKGDMIKEYIKWDMDEDNFYGKLQINDIKDTCYGQASSGFSAASSGFSIEHFRLSLDSFQQSTLGDKVKTSISSLFEDFARNETHSNCSKVQDLLINVLQCLVENKCICSQSTEKLNCSSQDENISVGTNMESGDTLKLPSTDTSKNQEGNQGNSVRCSGSQQSNNSANATNLVHEEKLPETKQLQKDAMIATTDQIISRLVEPGNIDKIQVEPMLDVNNALFKLQIKDPVLPHQTRKDESKEKFVAEQSYGNSASLDHMLNNGKDAVGLNCDAHTSRVHTDHDLSHKKDEAEEAVNSEFTTPHKLHAIFSGINNMEGKENSATLIDNSSGRKSSSIQCGQRTHNYEAQLLSVRNINNKLSETNNNLELSSESRIQSYSSHDYDGFENIGIDDFEIDDGRPSLSLRESWLASPRGQVLRHEHMRKLAQRQFVSINEEGFQHPQSTFHAVHVHSARKVDSSGTTSPQRTNSVPSPNSPARNGGNDIISISSQESPEVVFLKEIRGSEINNSHDSYDDVYIGKHRLSPVRRHTSEAIDAMYDKDNLSNQKSQASSSSILPPRRIVMPSRYVSSPYDENISSYEQDQDQRKHYEAIIRLANMDGYKHKMAIQIGNCKVSVETFGNSFKPGGTVEAWVINLYCRILFLSNHPKTSNRHTFFHTSSEYFLEKWENESRRLYMKDQAIKAFEGAGKARKLHLTDSLHFPSLYNYHWFLFTVDIRDKKFIFMDSLFDKNSDLHQEVDNRMIMNFGRTWSECRLKEINFQEFEVIYPPVPKQKNGKDCGIHLMKSIELFKPRTSLMGKFSHKDIPYFRIQMANEMMFCEHNEMHEIQEAVMTFKPHVHGTYARMG